MLTTGKESQLKVKKHAGWRALKPEGRMTRLTAVDIRMLKMFSSNAPIFELMT